MTENFFRKQVLDQLMKLLIIIVILSSSIRLNIIVYLVNDLCTEVLLSTDILIREEVNIDLKQNKLTIDYWEADLVFKTSQNSTDMHIIMQPTMHEIFCQQRLNYAALLSQFQVKTPSHQGKLPALTALSTLSLTLLCEGTTSNCHMNIVLHLIVVNLYNHFCHDTKTLQDFISIWKKLTTPSSYGMKPYLTVHDLCKHFVHTIISLTSHHQINFKMPHCHIIIKPFSHNTSTLLHKHIIIAVFSSL